MVFVSIFFPFQIGPFSSQTEMLQKGGVTLRTPCQLADLRGAVGKNDKPDEKSEMLFRYYRVLVFHFKLIFFSFSLSQSQRWIWTLDLKIIRRSFYHCASRAQTNCPFKCLNSKVYINGTMCFLHFLLL